MRNLRKILAVVVVVAMLAVASVVPAFADTTLSASTQTCANLGMLLGTGNGVTADYAASTPTRIQAAVLFLRLKGLEADAKAFVPTTNFADADKASWAAPIMGYLKANPALGWVGDGTNFNPNDAVTAQQYYKVVLTALGYVQDTDFTYANTLSFAKDTAKLAMAGNVANFTIDAVAAATVEGLGAVVKGGTDNLATVLVKANKLDATKAQTAGLYNPVVPVAATVAATGAKILTVTFNQAVDTTKATFAVAKSTFAVNVASTTWDAAKTVATITLATKLTAGDYTVTVSGLTTAALTAKVTAADETVSKIVFPSKSVSLDRTNANTVYTTYQVFNQYNEDVTSSYTPTFTASKGTVTANSGTLTITTGVGGANYNAGDSVSLSAIYASNGTFASGVFTVSAAAQAADITFGSLYESNGNALQVNGDAPNSYKLIFTANDQYGNAITDPVLLAKDLMVTLSSTSYCGLTGYVAANNTATITYGDVNSDGTKEDYLQISDPTALFGNDQTKLVAGTTTVTLISKTTGHMAKFDVVVKDAVKADTVTLSAPSLAVAGETTTIPFTAVDQFGNTITSASNLGGVTLGVTGVAGLPATPLAFSQDYVKGVPVLTLDTTGVVISTATNVVLTAVTPTGKLAQLSVSLQPNAVPTVIAAVNAADGNTNYNPNLDVNASTNFQTGNIVVNDQYGRAIDMTKAAWGAYSYKVTTSDTPGSIETLAGDNSGNNANGVVLKQTQGVGDNTQVNLTAVAKGSVTLTMTLYTDAAATQAVANSDFTFGSKVAADADIVSYSIGDMANVYASPTNKANPANRDHAIGVSVSGKLADGTVVVVPAADYTVVLSTIDPAVHYDVAAGVYATSDANVDGTTGLEAVPLVVTVKGANGATTITKNVTVSNAKPAITTLSLASSGNYTVEDATNYVVSATAKYLNGAVGGATITDALNAVLSADDQYGIAIPITYAVPYIYSNNSNSHAEAAIAAGDTFNVTIITNNGITKVFKFIAE